MPPSHVAVDFVAWNKQGDLILLAEAKSRHGAAENWAARLRGNMIAHRALPRAHYFLIATPALVYLWNQEGSRAGAPADFAIDAVSVFTPYFRKFNQEPSDIGPEEFRLLVLAWLTGIARPGGQKVAESAEPWLAELTGSLQNAFVAMNVCG